MSGEDKPMGFEVRTQGLHYVTRDNVQGQRSIVHLERPQDLRMLTLAELAVLGALLQVATDEVARVTSALRTGKPLP